MTSGLGDHPPTRSPEARKGRSRLSFILAALAPLALAACVASIDAEQARICRSAIPALNPGESIAVIAQSPGPSRRSLTIDYDVGGSPRRRHVVCVFAGEGLSARKTELLGIATEEGPLSDASFYFLRRFHLDSPEGTAGTPGEPPAAALELPLVLAYVIQQLLLSLPRTAIYALLATAYALVFGLVGRINLAFGELAAIGSAATIAGASLVLASGSASSLAGIGLGLLGALWAGALHSVVSGTFALARVRARSPQPSLIATVGLSIALMEYLRLVQSPVTVWLPPLWSESWPIARAGEFRVSLAPISLVTAGVALAAGLGLLWLMQATRFGRAWRAYADDTVAAALFGIDGAALLRRTLALAGAMAALSGLLIVVQYGGLGFAGGFQYGLKALIAAIIGGIGSVPGALLGGLAVGLFETLWSSYLPIEARDVALYAALVVFLVFRPGGFLGIRDPTPRAV